MREMKGIENKEIRQYLKNKRLTRANHGKESCDNHGVHSLSEPESPDESNSDKSQPSSMFISLSLSRSIIPSSSLLDSSKDIVCIGRTTSMLAKVS